MAQRWGQREESPAEPLAGFDREARETPSRGKKDVEQTPVLGWPQVHSALKWCLGYLQSCSSSGAPNTERVVPIKAPMVIPKGPAASSVTPVLEGESVLVSFYCCNKLLQP